MTLVNEKGASLSDRTDAVAVTSSHRRLGFLDAIRGLAALVVIFQHFGTGAWPEFDPFARTVFDFGQFGVVAFFLVSGFIIPVSLEKYRGLGAFWKARFFRLYPLYWVSLIGALLLIPFQRYPQDPSFLQHPVLYGVINLTMLQRFVGVPDAESVYWTLAVEMVFYLLCTFLVWRKWSSHYVLHVLVVAVAVALINNVLAFGLHRSPPAMHLSLVLTAFIGAVAYRVYCGEIPLRYLNLLFPVVLAVVAEGFWLHYILIPQAGKPPVTFGAIFAAWIAGYLLFFLLWALRGSRFPAWMQWLGQISYSLYLLHVLVSASMPDSLNPVLRLILSTVVTLGLSHLTYRYIERPAIKLGR